jgi:DNA-binding NarL/FixJ family response regulator
METRGLEVVGEASDGRQAIELAIQLKPDLVLMDLSMPVLDGIEATRQLRAIMPELKVVILTASMEEEGLVEAELAGAHGFLLKDFEADGIFDLLDRALADEQAASVDRPAAEAQPVTARAGRRPESPLRPAAPAPPAGEPESGTRVRQLR